MVVYQLWLALVGRPEPGLDRGRQHGDSAPAWRRRTQSACGAGVELLYERGHRLSFLIGDVQQRIWNQLKVWFCAVTQSSTENR